MKLDSLFSPDATKKISLGLDIGTSSIKVLTTTSASGRITIRDAISIPLPLDLIKNGVVLNPKQLGQIIRDRLTDYDLASAVGGFSVPSQVAAIKWIALPNIPANEIRSAARFKVRKHLPFPVDDAYIETMGVAEEDAGQGETLVIAVPKRVIESRAEALEHAGVAPITAEIEPFAIMRLIDRQLRDRIALWRNASLTIIDIGGTATHMYVVQGQNLQFIRSVPFGSNHISASIAKQFDVSPEAARTALSKHGAAISRDGALSIEVDGQHLIAGQAQEFNVLIREFSRLIRYFRSLHPERSYGGILDQTVLSGGLSGLNGLSEYLGKSLSLRIEVAQPFKGFLTDVSTQGFKELSSHGKAYTVAGGLALACAHATNTFKGGKYHERHFEWHRVA